MLQLLNFELDIIFFNTARSCIKSIRKKKDAINALNIKLISFSYIVIKNDLKKEKTSYSKNFGIKIHHFNNLII